MAAAERFGTDNIQSWRQTPSVTTALVFTQPRPQPASDVGAGGSRAGGSPGRGAPRETSRLEPATGPRASGRRPSPGPPPRTCPRLLVVGAPRLTRRDGGDRAELARSGARSLAAHPPRTRAACQDAPMRWGSALLCSQTVPPVSGKAVTVCVSGLSAHRLSFLRICFKPCRKRRCGTRPGGP